MIGLLLLVSLAILWLFGMFVLVSGLIHEYEMRLIVGKWWILQALFILLTLGTIELGFGYVIFTIVRDAFRLAITYNLAMI